MIKKIALTLLMITTNVNAGEMEDAYARAITSGSSNNANALAKLQTTDLNDVETNIKEVTYTDNLGDEAASKTFALSNSDVKAQHNDAQQTLNKRPTIDVESIENPDQHASDQGYCHQGDCYTIETADHTDDMVKSAAVLDDVLGGGASYASSGKEARIYTGKSEKCKQDNWGFADCCTEEGWGINLNLANCPKETKDLGKKKEKRLCHLVGKYQEKIRKLGIVIRVDEYKGYCCFPSEMAKLTHEDGRPQVKMSWGSPKYPNCQGFSADQFAKLDFSKIDLDPVYDDINKNMKTPSRDSILEQGIESW